MTKAEPATHSSQWREAVTNSSSPAVGSVSWAGRGREREIHAGLVAPLAWGVGQKDITTMSHALGLICRMKLSLPSFIQVHEHLARAGLF